MSRIEIRDMTLSFRDFPDLSCHIPCTVLGTLLEHGMISEPLYRDGEMVYASLMEVGCTFTAKFRVPEADMHLSHACLRLWGVDTIAKVQINGCSVAHTESVHCLYTADISGRLRAGENILTVSVAPPHTVANRPPYLSGSPYAPATPDMGIVGGIQIFTFNGAMIDTVGVRQSHRDGKVTVHLSLSTVGEAEQTKAVATLVSPRGQIFYSGFVRGAASITVTDPSLWWPRGLGVPNLYKLVVSLYSEGEADDTYETHIGLREFTVDTAPDARGRCFVPMINGRRFFAKGTVLLPGDTVLSRVDRAYYEHAVRACADLGCNMVRVHGCGLYPPDSFFTACDRAGILVWQDVLTYPTPDGACLGFLSDLRSVLTRLSGRHPSFVFLAGNTGVEANFAGDENARREYLALYGERIPELVAEMAPDVYYWSSTPSSGKPLESPSSALAGDYHAGPDEVLWDPALRPARFYSSIGFPALPHERTAREFSGEEEPNLFSRTMDSRNRTPHGNGAILAALDGEYLCPGNFADAAYLSQVSAAEHLRLSVENLRRHRDSTGGVLVASLGEPWASVSPALVDGRGREKAALYALSGAFSPVCLSVYRSGGALVFNISNEREKEYTGTLRFAICDAKNSVVRSAERSVSVPPFTAADVISTALSDFLPDRPENYYLFYSVTDGSMGCSGTYLFVPPREFRFADPQIRATLHGAGREFEIQLTAKAYARAVQLSFRDRDAHFSDNFFDITSDAPVKITATLGDTSGGTANLKDKLVIRSLWDVGR